MLGELMGLYAGALARPELAQPNSQRSLIMDDLISQIFPASACTLLCLQWLAPVRSLSRARLQDFVERLRRLLEGGAWDPQSPAGQQLACLLQLRVRCWLTCHNPASHA